MLVSLMTTPEPCQIPLAAASQPRSLKSYLKPSFLSVLTAFEIHVNCPVKGPKLPPSEYLIALAFGVVLLLQYSVCIIP